MNLSHEKLTFVKNFGLKQITLKYMSYHHKRQSGNFEPRVTGYCKICPGSHPLFSQEQNCSQKRPVLTK